MGLALEEPEVPAAGASKQVKLDGFEVVSADAAKRKSDRAAKAGFSKAAKGAFSLRCFLLSDRLSMIDHLVWSMIYDRLSMIYDR